ncbi:MAG: polyguluronate lyase precursor [uncultured bacterium]|nr:MAG: polyguluronate lyase precursor [uncultured bacterium]
MKKYLLILAIIIPLGGFFVAFQHFSSAKTIKSPRIVAKNPANKNVTQDEPQSAPITKPEIQASTTLKTDNPTDQPIKTSCQYPSEILNLSNWKQTLPTGSNKKPTEIKEIALASFQARPYFLANSSCDGVVFRAPVNGVTTSGSGYPRSELREMTNGGKSLASWSTTSAIHSMYLEQAITAVPKKKKHVVAGQIHDADDDVVVIRLEYPKLFVDINGKAGPTLDPNYTLGKKFSVKFVADKGTINIFYNESASPVFSMKKSGTGNYFKAGAYTQSNCSKETDCSDNNFGEVVIYKLALQ